jgi:nucleotide-binding universal stress UspA family protein
VRWLERLPLPTDRVVRIVTAILSPIPFVDVDRAVDARDALLTDARRLVHDAAAEVRLGGDVAIGEVVVEDDPRVAIVAAAREWGADLVVMGARGLSSVARFFLGSVSRSVAREAPCPVLVCKGAPRQLRAVTVALDGSDHARRALDWATSVLTPSPELRLRLLGVVEPQRYPSRSGVALGPALERERRAALEAELSAAAGRLGARGLAVETAVLRGAPAEIIVRDVERSDTDLVIVGARGLGPLKRLLLGSVSEAVLTHAGSSVLTVRAVHDPAELTPKK